VAAGRVPPDVVNREVLAQAGLKEKLARYALRLTPMIGEQLHET